MDTVTVAKKFDFHAAHRLPHHEGQCRRLHGHTYALEVAVTGPLAPYGGSDEGMVLDFSQLKDIYKMLIEPYVEHHYLNETLASSSLEIEYPFWTDSDHDRDDEPDRIPLTTAEGLATWIHKTFCHGIFTLMGLARDRVRVQVTVWETPTSNAQVGSIWRGNGSAA